MCQTRNWIQLKLLEDDLSGRCSCQAITPISGSHMFLAISSIDHGSPLGVDSYTLYRAAILFVRILQFPAEAKLTIWELLTPSLPFHI